MKAQTPDGRVVTFYSYKGGTGRTMALANVAWILAANGKRVLVVDWDLEAPGLHQYFLPFMDDPDLKDTSGLMEMVSDYLVLVTNSTPDRAPAITGARDVADPRRYAVALQFEFESDGALHLLGAGRQDNEYAERVRGLDWHRFYVSFGGNAFVEELTKKMKSQYDYVLIDSRTGVADIAGICTLQLPDQLILCFTYNRQSVQGVAAVARSATAYAQAHGRSITLLPLPTRVVADVEGIDDAREFAQASLAPFLPQLADRDALLTYWDNAEVPHYPAYGFEETLAAFRERAGGKNNMLADMEWLTAQICNSKGPVQLPHMEPEIRDKYLHRFRVRDPRKAQLNEALQKEPILALRELISLANEATRQRSDVNWRSSVADAFDQLAVESQASGQWEEALSATEEAVAIRRDLAAAQPDTFRPTVATSLNNLATMLSTLGQRQAALSAAREAVDLHYKLAADRPDTFKPELTMSLNNLATMLSNVGREEEALQILERAFHYSPANSKLAARYAGALQKAGREEHALEILEQAFHSSPPDSQLAARYAGALQKAGREEHALEILEQAFHSSPPGSQLATRYAGALQKAGREEHALEILEQAFHSSPPDSQLAARYAGALQRAGREEHALEILERAFHSSPPDSKLAARYAEALQRAGREEHALDILERALHYSPANSKLAARYAEALQRTGREEHALQILERALHYSPANSKLASRYAGALQRAGREEHALQILERAFHYSPPDSQLAARYAEALQRTGREEHALQILERAFHYSPPDSQLATRYAEALQRAGREEHALQILERAFHYSPPDSQLATRYAEALQRAGREEHALQILERAFRS